MKKSFLLLITGLLINLSISTSAVAVLMTIEYSGLANTLGYNSSSEFHGSSIVGHITYESDSLPTQTNQLSWDYRFWEDTIRDFGFTITFPDFSTYESNGFFVNVDGQLLGGIDIGHYYNNVRVDFFNQGRFVGDPFSNVPAAGFNFRMVDGYFNQTHPLLSEPADVLYPDRLPDSPFTLDDLMGQSVLIKWENPNNIHNYYQFQSYLTEVNVSEVTDNHPVPEPATMLLFGLGLLGLAGVNRRKK